MRMSKRAAGVGWMEAGSSSDVGAHDVCVRSGERDEQWREGKRTRASGERLSLRGRDVLTATGHESPPRLNTRQHNRNRNNSTTSRVVDVWRRALLGDAWLFNWPNVAAEAFVQRHRLCMLATMPEQQTNKCMAA